VLWSKGLPAVVPTPKQLRGSKKPGASSSVETPSTSSAILSVLFENLTSDDLKKNANKPLHLTQLPDLTKLLTLVDGSSSQGARPLSETAKIELNSALSSTAAFLKVNGPLDTLRYLAPQELTRE